MKKFLTALVFSCIVATTSVSGGDDLIIPPPVSQQEMVKETNFRKVVVRNIRYARQDGAISAQDAIDLRVAMYSPAFRKMAEELAVIQIYFSGGGDDLPRTPEGAIDRGNFNWEGFTEFIKAFVPLLLEILREMK